MSNSKEERRHQPMVSIELRIVPHTSGDLDRVTRILIVWGIPVPSREKFDRGSVVLAENLQLPIYPDHLESPLLALFLAGPLLLVKALHVLQPRCTPFFFDVFEKITQLRIGAGEFFRSLAEGQPVRIAWCQGDMSNLKLAMA